MGVPILVRRDIYIETGADLSVENSHYAKAHEINKREMKRKGWTVG